MSEEIVEDVINGPVGSVVAESLEIGEDEEEEDLSVQLVETPGCLVVRFFVNYETRWGQSLRLVGEGDQLGNWDHSRGVRMECQHVDACLQWHCMICVSIKDTQFPILKYKYVVIKQSDKKARDIQLDIAEFGERQVTISQDQVRFGREIQIHDTWHNHVQEEDMFKTSAFNVIFQGQPFRSNYEPSVSIMEGGQQCWSLSSDGMMKIVLVRFIVHDVLVKDDEKVMVKGSIPQLGSWQDTCALPLKLVSQSGVWQIDVKVPLASFTNSIRYQYLIHNELKDLYTEEDGQERIVSITPPSAVPGLVICEDGNIKRRDKWKGAGMAVPVFSLRSLQSVGVGDFQDIMQLIDLAADMGFHLIQILPVNDTRVHNMWWDSYPYSSVSVFALHPLYLNLEGVVGEHDEELDNDVFKQIDIGRKELDFPEVDYEQTLNFKIKIAKVLFSIYGDQHLKRREYQEWFQQNSEWLRPYAAFIFLSKLFGNCEHWNWGNLSQGSKDNVDKVLGAQNSVVEEAEAGEVQFNYWLQYHLWRQLRGVRMYAEHKGIALKGDLPIGIDKQSADAWTQPQLFRMHTSTGSPPDYFNTAGQNWGFPTYNWEEMESGGYGWFRQRLQYMAQFFHAYRIDHILGFFRIWEIPADCVSGMLGYFRPAHPIKKSELEDAGIWDIDRLCEPYITQEVLEEEFGELVEDVYGKYIIDSPYPPRLQFRPRYQSEKQIQEGVVPPQYAPLSLIDRYTIMRQGLLKIRQNVVFVRDPQHPNLAFHPRIYLYDTRSFQALPKQWQQKVKQLHDDYYYKRQEGLWRKTAMQHLPMLQKATNMLVFGEDLGFVPRCVPPVLKELGILGLRIQRMSCQEGEEFNQVDRYPYTVACSPSCHDTTTMRAWWDEDTERAKRYHKQVIKSKSLEFSQKAKPSIISEVLWQHLMSPAMWVIFPIQDILALKADYSTRESKDETINDPGNAKHYWRYRVHVTLETLCQDSKFKQKIRELLITSGRTQLDTFQVNDLQIG